MADSVKGILCWPVWERKRENGERMLMFPVLPAVYEIRCGGWLKWKRDFAGGEGMSWMIHEDMKIEMTKGDTPSFAFQAFLPDGTEYEFEEGDSVVFAAKRNKADPEPAVRIEADVKEKVIRFAEEDTKDLELGRYIWELSLNKSNGYRCTFIANKVLKLTVEVA